MARLVRIPISHFRPLERMRPQGLSNGLVARPSFSLAGILEYLTLFEACSFLSSHLVFAGLSLNIPVRDFASFARVFTTRRSCENAPSL
jgi:hypothetical protein